MVGAQDKVKKERDYHRLAHRRLAADKASLMLEVKRLKEAYGPITVRTGVKPPIRS